MSDQTNELKEKQEAYFSATIANYEKLIQRTDISIEDLENQYIQKRQQLLQSRQQLEQLKMEIESLM